MMQLKLFKSDKVIILKKRLFDDGTGSFMLVNREDFPYEGTPQTLLHPFGKEVLYSGDGIGTKVSYTEEEVINIFKKEYNVEEVEINETIYVQH